MKKSSLGRRSSVTARTSVRTSTVRDVGSARKEHSGIPIRARSSDCLNSVGRSTYSAAKRSTSEVRRTETTPANRRLTFSDRQSSISRASSIGGTKSRRDNRPLQDKEWQFMAQKKIEDLLYSDPEGSNILVSYGVNGSIKPLSLKLFIEMVNYFFQSLDPTISIDKQNYIGEIQHHCKRMYYRGKIEKSWLISVNTPHSWIHALGLLEFLATCILCLKMPNPSNLLFPIDFNAEDECDDDEGNFWDFKLILPYLWESYSVGQQDEESQSHLDNEIIKCHIDEDLTEKLKSVLIESEKLEEKYEKMTTTTANICQDCKDRDTELKEIENNIEDLQEYCENVIIANERTVDEIDKKKSKIASLQEEINMCENRKSVLNRAINSQTVSHEDIKDLKNEQVDVQKEIEYIQKCIDGYEDVFFKEDLEIVQIKKILQDTLLDLNVKIAEFISIEPEISQATINTGIDALNEDHLNKTQNTLSNLQVKYQEMFLTLDNEIKNIQEVIKEKISIVAEIEKCYEEKQDILKSIKTSEDSSKNTEEKKLEELQQKLNDYILKIKQMQDPDVKLEELIAQVEKNKIKIKEMEQGIAIFDKQAKAKIEEHQRILNERYVAINEISEGYKTFINEIQKTKTLP